MVLHYMFVMETRKLSLRGSRMYTVILTRMGDNTTHPYIMQLHNGEVPIGLISYLRFSLKINRLIFFYLFYYILLLFLEIVFGVHRGGPHYFPSEMAEEGTLEGLREVVREHVSSGAVHDLDKSAFCQVFGPVIPDLYMSGEL